MKVNNTTEEFILEKEVVITDRMGIKHEGTVVDYGGFVKLKLDNGGMITFCTPKSDISEIYVKHG
jgi:hypothetical protein